MALLSQRQRSILMYGGGGGGSALPSSSRERALGAARVGALYRNPFQSPERLISCFGAKHWNKSRFYRVRYILLRFDILH